MIRYNKIFKASFYTFLSHLFQCIVAIAPPAVAMNDRFDITGLNKLRPVFWLFACRKILCLFNDRGILSHKSRYHWNFSLRKYTVVANILPRIFYGGRCFIESSKKFFRTGSAKQSLIHFSLSGMQPKL